MKKIFIINCIFLFCFIILSVFAYAIFPDNDCFSYYSMDNNYILNNITLDYYNNNNLYLNNNITTGVFLLNNEAYKFDGENDYLNSINTFEKLDGASEVTVNYWINISHLGDYDYVFVYRKGTNYFMNEYSGGGHTIYLEAYNNDISSNCYVGYIYPYFIDKKTMVTIIFNGNKTGYDKLSLYLNSTLQNRTLDVGTCPDILASINETFYIGQDSFGSNFFNGTLDEFGIWNRSLSQSEINDLYNNGYGDFPENDTIPPKINLIYPINKTYYNNYNGSIILNISENGNCSLNNSDWVLQFNDNINMFNFYRSGIIPDNNYSISYYCNDISGNWNNNSFWFISDIISPNSNLINPLNNSLWNNNVSIELSYSDSLGLYKTNTTIFNKSNINDVMFNDYSGEMYNKTYDVTGSVSLDNGTYRLLREATDGHTKNFFNEDIDTGINKDDKIFNIMTYKLDYGDILFKYPKITEIITIKETDRFTQTFKSSVIGNSYFEIVADNIYKPENSNYPCHLIINNNYWYDCMGLLNPKMIKLNDNHYRIDYEQDKYEVKSKSLGGLNYANWTTYFYVDTISPIINITYPLNNSKQDDYTGYINIKSNENVSCSLNDTNWILQYSTGTNIIFYNNNTDFGEYNINYYCHDTVYNWFNNTLNFEYSVPEGEIIVYFPDKLELKWDMTNTIILIVSLFIYVMLLYIGFKTENIVIMIFALIYGFMFTIWAYNNTLLPKILIVIFGLFNVYIIFGYKKNG